MKLLMTSEDKLSELHLVICHVCGYTLLSIFILSLNAAFQFPLPQDSQRELEYTKGWE